MVCAVHQFIKVNFFKTLLRSLSCVSSLGRLFHKRMAEYMNEQSHECKERTEHSLLLLAAQKAYGPTGFRHSPLTKHWSGTIADAL